MKGFLWSVGILLLLLGLVIGNALAVGAKIRQTENEIAMIEVPTPGEEPSKTDLSRQKEAVAALRGRWERRLHLISLTVNHNDLMAVQEQLATLEGAADAGDYSTYTVALSVLREALSHLGKLAGAGPDVLF